LHQLETGRELPGELPKEFVLFIFPRERRIRSGLAVVIAEMLIPGEEPHSIPHYGTAQIRRDVAIPLAFVPGAGCGARDGEPHGFTRERRRLQIVRTVKLK